MSDGKQLFAADIAAMRGITRTTAWRWLVAVEKRYGVSVVGRIGNRPYTTEAALQAIAPKWKGPDGDFQARLRDCEDTIDQLTRDAKALREELRALKGAARR